MANPQGVTPDLLERINIPFISRERLQALEIGYKGVFLNRLLIDFSTYVNRYVDFITPQTVISAQATSHQGNVIQAGTLFRPFANAPDVIYGQGVGLQSSYRVIGSLWIQGNYNYAGFHSSSQCIQF